MRNQKMCHMLQMKKQERNKKKVEFLQCYWHSQRKKKCQCDKEQIIILWACLLMLKINVGYGNDDDTQKWTQTFAFLSLFCIALW